MKKTNKTKEVLRFLETHKKGITAAQAWNKFGVSRLSDLIFKFRQQGIDIVTINEQGKDRYGNTSQWARYVMKDFA